MGLMVSGVYLAYPIDQRGQQASLAYMFNQIEFLKRRVLDEGLASWCYDPGDAFRVRLGATPDASLATINRAALYNSEAVVAFLPQGVPTIGVPIEIDRARAAGIPVIVLSDAGGSWMLNMRGVDRIPGWQEDDIEAVIGWMRRIEPKSPQQRPVYHDLPFLVEEGGQMPTRAHADDAGLDLYTSERTVVPPGAFRDIPSSLRCDLPGSHWALVTGRSSALRKKGLLVHSGIIDPGYRGLLYAGAFNLTDEEVVVEEGERVAQFIPIHNATRGFGIVQTHGMTRTERGESGFGSSGA